VTVHHDRDRELRNIVHEVCVSGYFSAATYRRFAPIDSCLYQKQLELFFTFCGYFFKI
jgi:hypothetical protein